MPPASSPSTAAARFTGRQVTGERPLSASLTEVDLDDGRTVMVKRGEGTGAARAEAAGLRWLAAAGTVRIPAVHGDDERWLVTDRVALGRAGAGAADRFGRDLAALHATGAPAFGAAPPGGPEDAYIGLAPMRNAAGDDWPRWYAEHRVLPYLRRAVDAGTLRAAEATDVERLSQRLPGPAAPPHPPARPHRPLRPRHAPRPPPAPPHLLHPAAHPRPPPTALPPPRPPPSPPPPPPPAP
ncbi:fructosamine kinase family protein, partial [Streptomyces vinaceusdrappus]